MSLIESPPPRPPTRAYLFFAWVSRLSFCPCALMKYAVSHLKVSVCLTWWQQHVKQVDRRNCLCLLLAKNLCFLQDFSSNISALQHDVTAQVPLIFPSVVSLAFLHLGSTTPAPRSPLSHYFVLASKCRASVTPVFMPFCLP